MANRREKGNVSRSASRLTLLLWQYGQAYVTLSRVRSKDGLSIDVAPSAAHIRAHPDVKAFYRLIDSKKESRKG